MKYLVANWKMHKTTQEVREFFATSRELLRLAKGVEIVFCPPFPLIHSVRDEIIGTPLKLGAQNLSAEEEGAYTGEVSGRQLAGMVDYVLVGHSERRKYFHEEGRELANKLVQASRHDLKPIFCFEKPADLAVINDPTDLILAYEPPGTIGTGHPDTPSNAASVAVQARKIVGAQIPVLYGGSVTAANVKEFLAQPDISGVLVGSASLNPSSWVDLVHAASS